MFRGIAIGNSFRKVAIKTICKENLIFNPAYLTDTHWVSKTDAVPVLSLNGIDNYLSATDLSGISIVSYEGNTEPVIVGNNITFASAGYIYYLELSNGSFYTFDNLTGTVILDKSVNNFNLSLNGTLTDCWSKRRVLLNNEDRTYLSKSNIEKVKAKLVNSTAVEFDGVTNKLTISNNSKFDIVTSKFFHCIFKAGNVAASDKTLFAKYTISPVGGYALARTNTNLTFILRENTSVFINMPIIYGNLYDIKIKVINNDSVAIKLTNLTTNNIVYYNRNIGEIVHSVNSLNVSSLLGTTYGSYDSDIIYLEIADDCDLNWNSIGEKHLLLNFTYCTNNYIYDQVSGTQYLIGGDPVEIVKQDILHSKIRKGYSLIAGKIIPPSLTEPTKDVLGNYLTHPASSNADNYSGTKIDLSKYINAGSITKFNYEDVDNLQLFGEEVDESHIRYYLYNQIIDDKCLRKTLNKLGITYLVDNNGNVIINNDNTLLLV